MFVEKQLIKILVLLLCCQCVWAGNVHQADNKLEVSIVPLNQQSLNETPGAFKVTVLSKNNTESLRIMVQPQGQMKLIEGQMMWRGAALANRPIIFEFTVDKKTLRAQGVMVTAVVAGKNGKQQAARDVYRFSAVKRIDKKKNNK